MSEEITGQILAKDHRFAIVVSRFNATITERLKEAAIETLARHGCARSNVTQVSVPGAYELPFAAQQLAQRKQHDAIIALGCIIRGDTFHFELVANSAATGLSQVSLQHNIPIAFGVLATNDTEQARVRSEGSNNHGIQAALTAIEMASLTKTMGS